MFYVKLKCYSNTGSPSQVSPQGQIKQDIVLYPRGWSESVAGIQLNSFLAAKWTADMVLYVAIFPQGRV